MAMAHLVHSVDDDDGNEDDGNDDDVDDNDRDDGDCTKVMVVH